MTSDLQQLQARYASASATAAELEHREVRLDQLSARVQVLRDEVAAARRVAEVEAKEASEWASDGFHHVFSRLTGRFDERVDREAQEAVAAAAAHAALEVELEESLAQREAARDAVRVAHEAKSSLSGLKRSIAKAAANDSALSLVLDHIAADLAVLAARRSELSILLRACSNATDDLKKALKLVTTTKRLAALDATSDSYSRWKVHELRETVAYASRLKRTLETLEAELSGSTTKVEFAYGLRNEDGSYSRDIWFDGVLIDGMMYQGISDLKENLENLVEPLATLRQDLLERSAALDAEVSVLKKRELEALSQG